MKLENSHWSWLNVSILSSDFFQLHSKLSNFLGQKFPSSRFLNYLFQWHASHLWRMLETKCVGNKFDVANIMLVTDLINWENHQHNEKCRQHNDSATNCWPRIGQSYIWVATNWNSNIELKLVPSYIDRVL